MLRRIVLVSLAAVAFWLNSNRLLAVDVVAFKHEPPLPRTALGAEQELSIRLGDANFERARLLVADRSGLKVIPMRRSGDEFEAALTFNDTAVLKYRFNVEDKDGRFHLSANYHIRQPAKRELEGALAAMQAELQSLKSKEDQLKAALFSVQSANPEELVKRKSQELGRAVVDLNRSERQAAEARDRVAIELGKVSSDAAASPAEFAALAAALRDLGFSVDEERNGKP